MAILLVRLCLGIIFKSFKDPGNQRINPFLLYDRTFIDDATCGNSAPYRYPTDREQVHLDRVKRISATANLNPLQMSISDKVANMSNRYAKNLGDFLGADHLRILCVRSH